MYKANKGVVVVVVVVVILTDFALGAAVMDLDFHLDLEYLIIL